MRIRFLVLICTLAQGGFYVVNMVDTYVGGFPLLFIGLFECVVLQYVYGEVCRRCRKLASGNLKL